MDIFLPDLPGSLPSFRISHLPVPYCDFHGLRYLKLQYIPIYHFFFFFFWFKLCEGQPKRCCGEAKLGREGLLRNMLLRGSMLWAIGKNLLGSPWETSLHMPWNSSWSARKLRCLSTHPSSFLGADGTFNRDTQEAICMYGDWLQISLGMGVCVCVCVCACTCVLGSSNTQLTSPNWWSCLRVCSLPLTPIYSSQSNASKTPTRSSYSPV